MKKLILVCTALLSLSGCSNPQEEASEIAQDLCNSLKREILDFNKYATKQYAEQLFDMYSENRNLYKSTVSLLHCKIDNVETLETEDTEKYRVNLKRGLFIVQEVDGDLKVTGNY